MDDEKTEKLIHFRLPIEIHQVLKVEAALRNTTIRALMSSIAIKALKEIRDQRLKREGRL